MPPEMEIELGTALHKIGINITDEYLEPSYLAQVRAERQKEDKPVIGEPEDSPAQ